MSPFHRPVRCKVKADGFTLIEVMIVCVIIAVLAAIALPFYSDYVRRGKIPEATTNLATKKIAIDAWYADKFTYTGAPACVTDATTSVNFTFTCTIAADGSGYTLTATGKNAMGSAFVYTINAAGAKTSAGPTGWGSSPSCWITKKGSVC